MKSFFFSPKKSVKQNLKLSKLKYRGFVYREKRFQFVTSDFFTKTFWPVKYIINLPKFGSESSGQGVGTLWPGGQIRLSTSLYVFHLLSKFFVVVLICRWLEKYKRIVIHDMKIMTFKCQCP